MKIALVVLILGGLAEIVYLFRERIKEWLPGLKSYIWNGFLTVAGFAVPILNYLGTVDFSKFMTIENAALTAVAVGVVGILISAVTKRPEDA